jgi:hypothetical protein
MFKKDNKNSFFFNQNKIIENKIDKSTSPSILEINSFKYLEAMFESKNAQSIWEK